MTASAFEQAKDKLQPNVFKHILNKYNQTDNPKLFGDKYRLLAIDGCDFTVPFNPNSVNVVPTSHGQDICQVHANILIDIAWDFEQFCKIKVRVCKFKISDDEYEVLITNLNRFEFPIEKMKELYHLRWDIETSFRELKYALVNVIIFDTDKKLRIQP